MTTPALSRRLFLAAGAGAGAAAALLRTEPAAAAVPPLRTYHDVNLSTHEAHVAELTANGYRPLTVSIYGTASSPVFAAAWVQRPGPAFVVRSNLDVAGLQAVYDYVSAFNYRITALAATGSASAPRFVVVAEQAASRSTLVHSLVRHTWSEAQPDPGPGTIEHELNVARFFKQVPRALALYGTADSPRFALVVEPNDAQVRWNADGINESVTQLQARITAQREQRGRLGVLAVSPAQRSFSLFRSDELAGGWVSRHNLTASGYQSELALQQGQGRYPVHVVGSGSGTSRRFAAVFVPSEAVLGPTMTRSGPDRSRAVDAVMERLLVENRVRQATLAVVQGRRLLYARAFTYGEPGYPVATPTSYFRMASSGKMLVAVLVLRLIQEGRLTLGTRLQSVLNLRTPSGGAPVDPRFGDITIEHLLRHTGGMENPSPWDVAAAFPPGLPVSKTEMLRYVASRPLASTPGSVWAYSNIGFVALGAVVEQRLGLPYIDALRTRVFEPLGASRVRLAASLPEAQPADEARYDSTRLDVGWSVVSAGSRVVPVVYGADYDHGATDSVSVAATDFARVLAGLQPGAGNRVLDPAHTNLLLDNAFGFDGRTIFPRAAWKGGAIVGTSSNIRYVENGLSYVVSFARNDVPGAADDPDGHWYPDFPDLDAAVAATAWPAGDLFVEFGMPPL